MRPLTKSEVDQVGGGVVPAVVGAMYVATHPTTIAAASFMAKSFVGGAIGGAGFATAVWLKNQVMK